MDTALILKQKADSGEISDFGQASAFLDQSELVKNLTTDFDFDILNLLNRLIEIAEIPFAYKLGRVQKWIQKLADLAYCNDGFSITGKSDDILSCYNSMITSILLRMEYDDIQRINKGIDWILKYQNLQRGAENTWKGSRILKYGGCMKTTPCYIGIVKAMIALSDYKKRFGAGTNIEIENKLTEGLEYILSHRVFLRKSNEQPITKDITRLTYPFSYKTNVIEILRLLKDNHLDSDPRCIKAREFLISKKQKDGLWRINSSHLPKCWIQFDKPNETGFWISHEIAKVLS